MLSSCILLVGSAILNTNFALALAATTKNAFTTAPPASRCSAVPTPSPLQGVHCGSQGTAANVAFISSFASCTGDYVGCYETCASNSACISFSYEPSTNTCNFYSQSVSGQNFQESNSGVYFYNRRFCFTAPSTSCTYSCTSTTLTTTLSATATTTATTTAITTATTTTTQITTTTTTTTQTAPTSPAATCCNNLGLQWAIYPNNQGSSGSFNTTQFNPTVYKTMIPNYQGVTPYIGFETGNTPSVISIYGSPYQFNSSFFVLDHRGYLFAPQTGTYTITLGYEDDITEVWVGSNAYSGWTRQNEVLEEVYPNSNAKYTFNAVQGQYYPIRIMFAQGVGQAYFAFALIAPDGTALINSRTGLSPYIVQFSCDGTAKQYPNFGSET